MYIWCFVCLVVDYHESVTDIDNKSIKVWGDESPLIVDKNLESTDLVLVKNGQRSWVAVRASAQCEMRLLARRVEVEPHYRIIVSEEVLEVLSSHSKALPQQLHYPQRQPTHCLAVLLVNPPVHVTSKTTPTYSISQTKPTYVNKQPFNLSRWIGLDKFSIPNKKR